MDAFSNHYKRVSSSYDDNSKFIGEKTNLVFTTLKHLSMQKQKGSKLL